MPSGHKQVDAIQILSRTPLPCRTFRPVEVRLCCIRMLEARAKSSRDECHFKSLTDRYRIFENMLFVDTLSVAAILASKSIAAKS